MKKILTITILLAAAGFSFAQTVARKQTYAVRTEGSLKIDGIPNEAEWLRAPLISGFTQREPEPTKPARFDIEVRVLYDNRAIYIAATMFDPHADSISQELSLRDNLGNTDAFAVFFDTYRDGNNGSEFIVMPSGTQADAKLIPNQDDDFSWSAVWESATHVDDKGWSVEMAIPYSALRFPNATEQNWRINFARQVRRFREISFWNEVNPNVSGLLNQSGDIGGISNIKPPVRLQATPFVAAYVQNSYDKTAKPSSSWGKNFNAGLDVKYGINDAFTLDMTLIPDFGQVQSDNKILNLSPYEVRFDENRQFFTEGVELFNKGDIFYSRRVGSIPNYFWNQLYDRLKTGDELVKSPSEAQLYNATKLSGRLKNGWGVGVFNAIAAPTYAVVKNTEGVERNEQITPLTNYNVLAFDQNLPYNSFVSLVNTNVWRSGAAYDANVTAASFDLKNKKNTYAVFGSASLAQRIFTNQNELSYKYEAVIAKISGAYRFDLYHNLESRNYNPNDLGFLRAPNESSWALTQSYNKFNTKSFNKWNVNTEILYARLERPDEFATFNIATNGFFLTKKIFAFGFNARLVPVNAHDFFEPRTSDFSRYFQAPKNYSLGGFISTDYAKKFAFDLGFTYRLYDQRSQNGLDAFFNPRFRINDRVSIIWQITSGIKANYPNFVYPNSVSVGYGGVPSNAIIFGERQQLEIQNTPTLKWNFNHLMGLNIRLRHYWTRVNYVRYYELGQKGELNPTTYRGIDAANVSLHNTNFNLFNIDANFTWRFAPGSDVILNLKQNVAGANSDVAHDYFFNASRLFDNPIQNSFSVKVIYFVDYLKFVKKV